MTTPMTEAQIRRTAEFYGIDMQEAHRRYQIVQLHTGDPNDPICVGCAKRPAELPEYDMLLEPEDLEGITDERRAELRKEACMREEGTRNPENGHFLCNSCYIRNGQPSSSRGWICP